MTRVSASAPGKIILFGEHAVVYGQPALAVPVHAVESTATLDLGATGTGLKIDLVDLGRKFSLKGLKKGDPIASVIRACLNRFGLDEPDGTLSVSSTIPIASGLGSGASVSAAICKVLASLSNRSIDHTEISEIVFEAEKIYHGTPSGIDNSVICYDKPISFVKGTVPSTLKIGMPFKVIIANSGIPSPTKATVASVRRLYENNSTEVELIIRSIGDLSRNAWEALKSGDLSSLGLYMNRNHEYLQQLGVSSPVLDEMVVAALTAGAEGAKLSGGGRGGNMIAYAPNRTQRVVNALRAGGATHVWVTKVS